LPAKIGVPAQQFIGIRAHGSQFESVKLAV
jgi:hypothetical protein